MKEEINNQNKSSEEIEEKIAKDFLQRIENNEFSFFSDKLEKSITEEIKKENYISKDWHQYYAEKRIKEKIGKYLGLLPTTIKERFLNLILDLIILYIISGLISIVTGNWFIVWVVAMITYYVFFESIWSKTPAKFITNTKVITEDGGKPTFKNILKRTLIRLIPFEPLSFLGLKRPKGWHDNWSNTTVIGSISEKFSILDYILLYIGISTLPFFLIGLGLRIIAAAIMASYRSGFTYFFYFLDIDFFEFAGMIFLVIFSLWIKEIKIEKLKKLKTKESFKKIIRNIWIIVFMIILVIFIPILTTF